MQIFFRSSKRKCGIKGSSSDELFNMNIIVQYELFLLLLLFQGKDKEFIKLIAVGTMCK